MPQLLEETPEMEICRLLEPQAVMRQLTCDRHRPFIFFFADLLPKFFFFAAAPPSFSLLVRVRTTAGELKTAVFWRACPLPFG